MWFMGMMMYVVANAATVHPPPIVTHHKVVRDVCGNVFVDGVALRNPINRQIGDYCVAGRNQTEDPSRIHVGPVEKIKIPPHKSPR